MELTVEYPGQQSEITQTLEGNGSLSALHCNNYPSRKPIFVCVVIELTNKSAKHYRSISIVYVQVPFYFVADRYDKW